MTDIEKLVEECARAILIADGVKYVKRDAEWEADVTRLREAKERDDNDWRPNPATVEYIAREIVEGRDD